MRILPFILILALLVSAVAAADSIILTDGTRLEGEVRKVPQGYEVVTADGKTTFVPSERVQSIRINPDRSTDTSAQGLASLRRAVANIGDLKTIVERYNRFIEGTKDPAVRAAAQEDLKQWQERLEKGFVRVGGKWIAPDERDELIQRTSGLVREAHRSMMQMRYRDAEPFIDEALEYDPQNIAALYLRGLVLLRDNQLVPARRTYEQLNSIITEHAPTLNNLAVINWRQKQYAASLFFIDQAMLAAPVNKLILDNANEMLNTAPQEMRRNAAYTRVNRTFLEQDPKLRATAEKQGLFRWGSEWVDKETMERYQKQEREIKDELAKLETEFTSLNLRAERLTRDMASTEDKMRGIEAASYTRDANGNLIRIPYPPVYYEFQRELQRLRVEYDEIAPKLALMRQQAQRLQGEMPSAKYTGTLNFVGPEGCPLPPPPADSPSTAPSAPAPPHIEISPPSTRPTTMPAAEPSTAPSTRPGEL